MRRFLFILLLLFCMPACMREELPVPAHATGDVRIGSVSLGASYEYQVFVDLETNSEVARNQRTDWILAFEASETGSLARLNTSLMLSAWNTGLDDFTSVSGSGGFEAGKAWDAPSGNPDSVALVDWKSGKVHVIDLGYDKNGVKLGFAKLQFMEVSPSGYKIRWGKLADREGAEIVICKDSLYNYIHMDHLGNMVPVEPPKDNWDLVFTQYTHMFTDMTPVMPYLLTGCLINSNDTWVGRTNMAFDDIDYEFALGVGLEGSIDFIGYDWKEYSFDTDSYVVYPEITYIIKNHKGLYYKFHFLDFYDSMGVKGNPTWELQKL